MPGSSSSPEVISMISEEVGRGRGDGFGRRGSLSLVSRFCLRGLIPGGGVSKSMAGHGIYVASLVPSPPWRSLHLIMSSPSGWNMS